MLPANDSSDVIATLVTEVKRLKVLVQEMQSQPQDNVIIKNTTGDPTGREGLRVINTVDNTYRIYADGAWRSIIIW